MRLGAPVMEPQGNVACKISAMRVCAKACASMAEVICHTLPKRLTLNGSGTRTPPVVAILPKSLRSKSTIMTFSARFLGSFCKAWARASSCPSCKMGAVPFMGSVVMMPVGTMFKNSSGEKHNIHCSVCCGWGKCANTA